MLEGYSDTDNADKLGVCDMEGSEDGSMAGGALGSV